MSRKFPPHVSGSSTSLQGAIKAKHKHPKQLDAVEDFVRRQGKRGALRIDVEDMFITSLGMDPQKVHSPATARVKELIDLGVLFEPGVSRKNPKTRVNNKVVVHWNYAKHYPVCVLCGEFEAKCTCEVEE